MYVDAVYVVAVYVDAVYVTSVYVPLLCWVTKHYTQKQLTER